MKRLQVYPAPGISVTFDPNLCQHSGVCLMTLPDVFDVRRARWIHADAASADRVAHAIDKCPSGALQYYRNVERDPSAAFRLSKVVATNRIALATVADGPRDERAREIAQALLEGRGYRWVGLYDVLAGEIAVVAWTGDEAPANPRFARTLGLNGAAVAQGKTRGGERRRHRRALPCDLRRDARGDDRPRVGRERCGGRDHRRGQ